MTTKKNPDYTASAVNLTNPDEVNLLLVQFHQLQNLAHEYDTELREKNAELYQKIDTNAKALAECEKMLRAEIEAKGSYQNMELGWYAVKSRAVMVSYSPEKVREVLPVQVQAAVIIESVDKAMVDALVKGGRITPEQQELISQKIESFRFIIR